MTFIIHFKDGHRETYSNRYDEDVEHERDAAWDDVYAAFPDADYIEPFETMSNMILEDREIRHIYLSFVEPVPIKGYAIRIDGQTFVTSKGKMLWKKKNHATYALRTALEPMVCGHVRSKLKAQGISEYYSHPEYRNAWANYRKYLEDNNLLQIIEFEW